MTGLQYHRLITAAQTLAPKLQDGSARICTVGRSLDASSIFIVYGSSFHEHHQMSVCSGKQWSRL